MNERNRTGLSAFGVLLALCVFAVLLLAVLLTGADAYRRLSDRDAASADSRTVVRYLATRVRQADRTDGVAVGSFGAGDSLLLRETIDGKDYVTRVYCWQGSLCELFTADEAGFSPEDGERLFPLERLEAELTEGVLYLEAGGQTLVLTLRSGREAGS